MYVSRHLMNANPFVTRSGRVAQAIARRVLDLELGAQLPTVTELAGQHGVGIGTVQKAVTLLRDEGCIDIQARGTLGTFLRGVNVTRLCQVAGTGMLVGVMPLPYSRRYEGLATGLRQAWKAPELPLLLSFVRGAEQRLHAIMTSHQDFAVVSSFAAEQARSQGWNIRTAVEFGPQTYVQGHVALFAPGRGPYIKDGYRVGIDRSSFDQTTLTQHECSGIEVEFIDVGYMQLVEALRSNRIQAAVWAADGLRQDTAEVTKHPLRNEAAVAAAKQMTTAVLVNPADNPVPYRLLRHAITPDLVQLIQAEVMSGERLPSY